MNAPTSGFGPNAAGQIKPDVCAMGQPANVIYGTYTQNSGTSFATPQIAGWAACLWEANPTATPYQLKNAIRQCASLYNSPNSHYGYGIANFMCTTWLLSKIDSPPIGTNANWVATLPNPFNDNIDVVINTTADQHIDFELMDITGRIILHFEANITISNNQPISINTKYLPKGIYLLKAVAATQQMVIKVVKG